MDVFLVLGKIISIFFIIFLGALGYRKKWFPVESEKYFMNLMMNITGPCLIFYSMQGQNRTSVVNAKALQVFILMAIAILLTCIISIILVKLLNAPLEDRGVYRMAMVFTNCGFMGYPLALAVFGEDGLFLAIIANMAFLLLIFSIGPFLLIYDQKSSGSKTLNFRTFVSIPLASSIIGLLIFILNIKLPLLVADTFKIVGEMTIPLAMLIIGIQLAQSNARRVFTNVKLIAIIIIRLVLIPIILFLIFFKAPMDPLVFCVVIFAMSLPAAAFIGVLASRYGCNSILAAECIFTTTLFSLISIPVVATVLNYYLLLKHYY